MFDRCDPQTVEVLDGAVAEARRLGHTYLGTEHLLLSLMAHRELLPEVVAELLPEQADGVLAALASVVGPPSRDTELLATLGIDLDVVRTAVGETFGSEALDRLGRRRVHQPWQPWRRPSRRCMSLLGGGLNVAPRVKQALERAVADTSRPSRGRVDPAGLLLGMVEVEDALSNRLLRDVGIDPAEVRRALLRAA